MSASGGTRLQAYERRRSAVGSARLAPLAAEIEADRVAFALPTTTAATEAIFRAGLDARALDRQKFKRVSDPVPVPAAPPRPLSYAATFAAAARIVFGLRGNEFDAEAVAFRLEGALGAVVADLPEVLRELCQLGLIADLNATTPRGPGRPRKPKYRVAAATKDEAARLLAEAARSGALMGRAEALIGMTPEREAEIAGRSTTRMDVVGELPPERQAAIAERTAELIAQAQHDPAKAPGHEDLIVSPEGLDAYLAENPLPEPSVSPVQAVMAHLLAHPEATFTAGEVGDAVGIGVDEALTILRDMVEDDAVEKTRVSPNRTVYGLVKIR